MRDGLSLLGCWLAGNLKKYHDDTQAWQVFENCHEKMLAEKCREKCFHGKWHFWKPMFLYFWDQRRHNLLFLAWILRKHIFEPEALVSFCWLVERWHSTSCQRLRFQICQRESCMVCDMVTGYQVKMKVVYWSRKAHVLLQSSKSI